MKIFGTDRTPLGHEDQEWAVWVSHTDDVHPQSTVGAALQLANSLNAGFAALQAAGRPLDHALYAVVLHHGYAWTAETEHQLGADCGIPTCGPCSSDRAFTSR
ncbi:hypothetical protein [Streptomyces thermolilacinus]|uniref:hypothetical protein n=1 Tax=Streptomyces thermolilacinus TaxID=285540 RepID=UPI00340803AC